MFFGGHLSARALLSGFARARRRAGVPVRVSQCAGTGGHQRGARHPGVPGRRRRARHDADDAKRGARFFGRRQVLAVQKTTQKVTRQKQWRHQFRQTTDGVCTLRLSVMQYVLAAAFAALAVGSGSSRSRSTSSSSRSPTTSTCSGCRCRRRAGLLFDRHGKVLVQNQEDRNIVLLASGSRTWTDAAGPGRCHRRRRRGAARNGRSAAATSRSYRPIVLIENATFAQVVAVRRAQPGAPGVEDLPVPTRRYAGRLAAHLFGYVGEITDRPAAASRIQGPRRRRHHRPVRDRAGLQQSADGRRGHEADDRQQPRPRNPADRR